MIKCGWNHPGWQSNGQVIGVPIVLREDSVGAYFEAVVDRTPVGDLVLERIRSRSLDGCSFAYNVTDSEPIYGAKPEVLVGGMVRTPRRLLKELQVVEIGPVDFPCHEGTRLFLHGALKAAPGLDGFKRDRDAASLLSNLDRLQRSLGAIADRSDEFKDTPARPHVTSNHYNQHHAWVQADSQERKARIMEQERRAARELAELRAEYAQPPRTRQSTDHELSLALRDLRALSSSLSSALTKATNDRNYHSDQIGSWTREQAARRRASAWSR
jgi:hypothetical protein